MESNNDTPAHGTRLQEDDFPDAVADPVACNQGTASSAVAGNDSEIIDVDPVRHGSEFESTTLQELEEAHETEASLSLKREWHDVAFNALELSRIARIPYTPEFRVTCGILFAARDKLEVSVRALNLTTFIILHNPSDVTAWEYRRFIIRNQFRRAMTDSEKLDILQSELAYSKGQVQETPKNYQCWEYRRFLKELGGTTDEERNLIKDALSEDTKNYHAWAHFAWISTHSTSDAVAQDMQYTEDLILLDVRNNSAWSHRWAIGEELDARTPEELDWAIKQMNKAPRNDSAWNYINALVRENVGVEKARNTAKNILEKDSANVAALRHLVMNQGCPLQERISFCKVLANEVDRPRCPYWLWKAERLERSKQA